MIRSFVHDRDPATLLSDMGSGAADIAQVVSEVRDRLPALPQSPALEPEQARFRLFDSITTFLRNASKAQPLVIIIDDLHWADKPSLLLLQFLARELRGSRLLVIGTYRDIELGRQHPLAHMLGELTREQLSERIVLRGLSERDVARFIQITTGTEPPEQTVAALYKETEGNPFFVNEIVRLLVTDGTLERPDDAKAWSVTIPQSVREVVGRRLDRLSEVCNQVLTVGAVIGREFGMDVLEPVSDVAGTRLVEALDEAVAARVVAEVPRAPGRYSFSHALIRETLYDELTTTRRVLLHRRIAEALEALYGAKPDAHLAELAYHFCEAAHGGDVERAVDYARRAGERASSLYAYEEAAGHFERALQVLDLREALAEQKFELLMALAGAWWDGGEYVAAREIADRAFEVAQQSGAAEQLSRAALQAGGRFSGFAAGLADYSLIEMLEEALAGLGEGDSALKARVMGRLAGELAFAPLPQHARLVDAAEASNRGQRLAEEAVAMARRAPDPVTLAFALTNAHWATWSPDNIDERLALMSEAVELAESVNSTYTVREARAWRFMCFVDLGNFDAARSEAAVLTQEPRRPFDLWAATVVRVFITLLEGRLAEGEALAQEALEIGQEGQNPSAAALFGVHLFQIRREQDRTEEMLPGLEAFAAQYVAVPAWRCALAMVYAELGREDEARAELDRLAQDSFVALPRDAFWLIGMSLLAQACWELGDGDRAAQLYPLLEPHTEHWTSVVLGLTLGSVSLYAGLLATVLERWDDAERHFERSLEQHAGAGAPGWLAWTRFAYADMLLRRARDGDDPQAVELVNQALDAAQDLGMSRLVTRALALKLRAQGIDPNALNTSIDAVTAAVSTEQPDLRPHAAPDGTVTIMFSDIEDSTVVTERLGDHAWQELLRKHNSLIREQLRAHDGFEVKTMGDGFMVAFQSTKKGLDCAIAIQRAFAAHNATDGEHVRVRIGLHAGEAIKDGGDFYGKNVILASRVAGQAKGAEILVSSLVRDLVESGTEASLFGEPRELELKGLSGTHRVYDVRWAQQAGASVRDGLN
jgi:class 3 adenylate cyclase